MIFQLEMRQLPPLIQTNKILIQYLYSLEAVNINNPENISLDNLDSIIQKEQINFYDIFNTFYDGA